MCHQPCEGVHTPHNKGLTDRSSLIGCIANCQVNLHHLGREFRMKRDKVANLCNPKQKDMSTNISAYNLLVLQWTKSMKFKLLLVYAIMHVSFCVTYLISSIYYLSIKYKMLHMEWTFGVQRKTSWATNLSVIGHYNG